MLDAQILSALIADRSAYDRIKDYIKDNDASPQVAFWLKLVREYYQRDGAVSAIDIPTLRALGERTITNPKHAPPIIQALVDLPKASPANIVEYVLALRRSNLSLEFAAANSSNDRKKASKLLDELVEIWDQKELAQDEDSVEYAKDWQHLDEVVGQSKRVPLGLSSLDQRIGGGVLPGHHILIFGRTEIGKSCLTISLAANLVRIPTQRILYVGNEDEINILKARMRLSLLGWPQCRTDKLPKKAARLLSELVSDRLVMVRSAPGSISQLEDLTEKHSPTVVIVDQIRNLSGEEDGMTQRMEHNAIRFRSLLNRKHLIGISVTQSRANVGLFLSADDVDSSKVGLPGTVDLMLGVSATQEMLSRNLRMISFAKNKLASGPQSREPLTVQFNLEQSRVSDGQTDNRTGNSNS